MPEQDDKKYYLPMTFDPDLNEAEAKPAQLPIFTDLSIAVFPGMHFGLQLTGPEVKIAKYAERKCDGHIGFILKHRDIETDPKKPQQKEFYRIGSFGNIIRMDMESPDTAKIFCVATDRIRLEKLQMLHGIPFADVTYPQDIMPSSEFEIKESIQLTTTILNAARKLIERRDLNTEDLKHIVDGLDIDNGGRVADFICTLVRAKTEEYQAILETFNVRERMEKALFLLQRDIMAFDLRRQIQRRVEKKLEKNQRNFVLQEQLREIKQELGVEIDSKENDLEKLEARHEELKPYLSPEAEQKISEEIVKLRATNSMSPDYSISKNYLDWLTMLPWNQATDDKLDVPAARAILNRDHYGLEDVKKRILEFIGVSKLKNSVGGSILCLIGPPGVGKTSIGRCVAEALGRKFFRFSLGGMRDEAEIKGHRRTYIGAQPGKIISALKSCGTNNPVIMLDEIDKLGSSHQGDPASALLEVLDPEQNASFRDHFLDIPFDLSHVLFIATANVRDTIPAPLLDRMEIINLSGYITEEKLAIAKKHLIPKQLPRHGLLKGQISFPDATIRAIINGYARESGVRALEKSITACMRKVATAIAEGETKADAKTIIQDKNLETYLGKPVFFDDSLMKTPRPGVAMGLAWTAMGGTTLYIEVLPINGTQALQITGQLGDVMKESTQIAASLAEAYAEVFGIAPDFFKTHKLHIHVPAGATPKDGPSAGITLATAIISAATKRALPPKWAMTGELTLTARVLPVGGIKEKMLAARRAGVLNVILPKDNEKDFLEINERAREGLVAHFVSDYTEVYNLLFASQHK